MASALSLLHIPRDVFLLIASYLPSPTKQVAAFVCKAFQNVCEDVNLLRQDSKRDDCFLSVRQWSILFSNAEKEDRYLFLTNLLDATVESFPISAKHLHLILEASKSKLDAKDAWQYYLKAFLFFSMCFRKSKEFQVDKAIKIFSDHFKKTEGFLSHMQDSIYTAAAYNDVVLIRSLVEAGINVNIPNSEETEDTVLSNCLNSLSEEEEQLESIKTLIELKADPRANDHILLYRAVEFQKEKIVRYLHSINIDINHYFQDDPIHKTVLFIALDSETPLPFIKILIELGADPLVIDPRLVLHPETVDYLEQEMAKRLASQAKDK